MPDCLASGHSGTGLKKTNDAETGPADAVRHFFSPVPDQNSGCGMSMLALVSSMPMPSYGFLLFCFPDIFSNCIQLKGSLHTSINLQYM